MKANQQGLVAQDQASASAGIRREGGAGGGLGLHGDYAIKAFAPLAMSRPHLFLPAAERLIEAGLKKRRRWIVERFSRVAYQARRRAVAFADGLMVQAREATSLGALPVALARRLQRWLPGNDLLALAPGGDLMWSESFANIVVNVGLDHVLDIVLSGGTQDTTWFIGLLASSPSPLATWTATEIAANDFVNYTEGTLQAFVDGGVSGQSVDNSASTADFSINTNSSVIGGAFLITDNTKATPAGTLYSAGAFSSGNKNADNGDTLSVEYTFTAADA